VYHSLNSLDVTLYRARIDSSRSDLVYNDSFCFSSDRITLNRRPIARAIPRDLESIQTNCTLLKELERKRLFGSTTFIPAFHEANIHIACMLPTMNISIPYNHDMTHSLTGSALLPVAA
jgi:hypothetical protein